MAGGSLVLTLDAGGTSFRFSAVEAGRPAAETVVLPPQGHDLDACLGQLRAGFQAVFEATGRRARALSFGFPGPADYAAGIIGDLENLPGFRGGVALGPMLEEAFGLPVFIHNDGDLFALGEARHGRLPEVNAELAAAGCRFRHRNLLGLTLGTGFGAGIVTEGRLLRGDNGAAAEIWLLRSKVRPGCFAEEGVSIRALRRAYAEAGGLPLPEVPEPKEIAAIARGEAPGDRGAAVEAFRAFGEAAGDAIAQALTLVDGLVVLGGGLAGAADLFLPALLAELGGTLATAEGRALPRLELEVFNLEDPVRRAAFLVESPRDLAVPGSGRLLRHDPRKRAGLALTRLGTSQAIALGAWEAAMEALGE